MLAVIIPPPPSPSCSPPTTHTFYIASPMALLFDRSGRGGGRPPKNLYCRVCVDAGATYAGTTMVGLARPLFRGKMADMLQSLSAGFASTRAALHAHRFVARIAPNAGSRPPRSSRRARRTV